ncbi:hypothetical protein N7493_004892 [Penicillium malachiteum]|uniref:Rhodopsin domain-containing protein n=1 Tax=Penicillium malachiteum TaxID=1324776 RepID=A0AAD6HLY8_9EURO|nr:hypothetical protein N7493_004892 [Penicillium malachiteum]
MPTQQKWGVAVIFWLGIFCCIAAIVRLILLHAALSAVVNNPDLIQPNCSIIAACLPTYGTLFTNHRSLNSILASWRSAFSIRSKTSSDLGSSFNNLESGKGRDSSTESQTELTTHHSSNWATQETTAKFSRSLRGSDEEQDGKQSSGIMVKTWLDVSDRSGN